MAHESDTLTLQFAGTFQFPAEASYGIRDISLSFVFNTAPSIVGCYKGIKITNGDAECECPIGEYLESDGSCQACNALCESCYGSGPNKCFKCKDPAIFDGEKCLICDSSCEACSGTSTFCTKCSNSSHGILTNGTCISCFSPLSTFPATTVMGEQILKCSTGCQTDEFYHWYGTCKSSCPPPLSPGNIGGDKICNFPCNEGDYLYSDGRCLSTCDFPYVSSYRDTKQFCDPPCPNPSDFYSNETYTCQSECNLPNIPSKIDNINICSPPPLTSEEVTDTVKDSKLASDLTSAANSGIVAYAAVSSMTGARGLATIGLVLLNKFLYYARYLKLDLPPRLQLYFRMQQNLFNLNVELNLPGNLEEKFPMQEIPSNFEPYELHSSFFVNYWDTITTIFLAFLAIPILKIVWMICYD